MLVLLYKDAEGLNVLRVIENEDGSYSPYPPDMSSQSDSTTSTPTTSKATTKVEKAVGRSASLSETAQPESVDNAVQTDYCTCSCAEQDDVPHVPLAWSTDRITREDPQQTETMFAKMAEDVEMANKLQLLKRRMRHLRALRQAKGDPPTKHASTAVESTIDMGLGEWALKEKHRSRSTRPSGSYLHNLHVFDPQVEESTQTPHHLLRMARVGLYMQEQEQDLAHEEAHQAELSAACSPAPCKVGLYQRRASLDYDGADFGLGPMIEPVPDDPEDIFYRLPAIPRYAAAHTHAHSHTPFQPPPPCVTARSPLYGRLSRNSNDNFLTPLAQSPSPEVPERNSCNIERVQNDYIDYDDLEQDVFGYYNAEFDKYISSGNPPPASIVSGSSGLDLTGNYFRGVEDEFEEEEESLEVGSLATDIKKLTLRTDFQAQVSSDVPPPPITPSVACSTSTTSTTTSSSNTGAMIKRDLPAVVTKKRMRCGQCNKRLNITNIYNCRCGLIFCAQHRYSESHDCKYDYKAEGRKLIEQQNPLVTASKLTKF